MVNYKRKATSLAKRALKEAPKRIRKTKIYKVAKGKLVLNKSQQNRIKKATTAAGVRAIVNQVKKRRPTKK